MTIRTLSVPKLIHSARVSPPVPVIEDLLYEDDIFLVHGEEASFKAAWAAIPEPIRAWHKLISQACNWGEV